MDASADVIFRSLAGSALGDALGLPYENLTAHRATRLLGDPDRFRFALGRGMVSDDAEHACMTAAAFAESGGDVDRFRRNLARRLRWWLLTIPPGIGLATLKSIVRLWIGWPPTRSGVWSAGNGPAMRSAVLGRLCPPDRLFAFVEASSRLTHRDPRATLGAYAVAAASRAFARSNSPVQSDLAPPISPHDSTSRDATATSFRALRDAIARALPEDDATRDLLALLDRVTASLDRGMTTEAFADSICRKRGRVSGFVYETVPVALHAAYAHAEPIDAIRAAIRCGGDTDSVASIVGGIRGIDDRASLERLIEWPCDAAWLRRLSEAAATRTSPPRLPWASRIVRNAAQLAIVLLHVARRAMPPY